MGKRVFLYNGFLGLLFGTVGLFLMLGVGLLMLGMGLMGIITSSVLKSLSLVVGGLMVLWGVAWVKTSVDLIIRLVP